MGTSPTVTAMRPEIHFTEGRMFQPGLHELVASNPCVRTFTGFELGAEREVRGVDWSVVGHFDQGNSMQCQVLADVAPEYRHEGLNVGQHLALHAVPLVEVPDQDRKSKRLNSSH